MPEGPQKSSGEETATRAKIDKIKTLYVGLKDNERTAFVNALNERRALLRGLIGEKALRDTRSSFAHFVEGEDRDITLRRYVLEDLDFLAGLLQIDKQPE